MASKSKTIKTQTLVDLIRRPTGATVDELLNATGWKPHTVRAVISTEKKKQGLVTELVEGRYKCAKD